MANGTAYKFVKRLFKDVDIRCSIAGDKLEYKISGLSKSVEELISFLEFLTTPPDKKFGFMFILHPSLTSSPERTEQLRNTVVKLASVPEKEVLICRSPQLQEAKWVFVPGIVGQQYLFKIQKHLNILVDALESNNKGEENESNCSENIKPSDGVDEVGNAVPHDIIVYTFQELLDIRRVCSEPHDSLVGSNLPIYRKNSTH